MGVVKKILMGFGGLFLLFILIGACASSGDSDNNSSNSNTVSSSQAQKQEKKGKVYADADIDVLLNEAKVNAAAAKRNYSRKDVKIIGGRIENIDSNLSYLTLKGSNQWSLLGVRCDIKSNEKLKDEVVKLQKNQQVVVYGRIKDVGDIMGYYLDMDKIEPAK